MFFEGERKPHLTADCIVTTVSIITIYVVTVKMCMMLWWVRLSSSAYLPMSLISFPPIPCNIREVVLNNDWKEVHRFCFFVSLPSCRNWNSKCCSHYYFLVLSYMDSESLKNLCKVQSLILLDHPIVHPNLWITSHLNKTRACCDYWQLFPPFIETVA